MSVRPDEFRALLGRFATGVTVLTARDASGGDHGMTVSAFCSVSLAPPLVLACIARGADMFAVARDAQHFGVSVLTGDQEGLSRRFADQPDNRFDGVGFVRGETGVVLLNDALGHLECRRVGWHDAGDHAICVGEVMRAHNGDGRPLLYYRGGYTQLGR
jgi:flavin reductase (DIM6/NTAB) family NADH-FMN oxidoreductase RutF